MMRLRPDRIPVTNVNPHLLCVLCGGYYIDATTIIECLHSYCRTCIVRYLETSKMCPLCDVLVHKTKPLENLRADKTLQDLVYKLIPGLFESEMTNRKQFYKEHPEECKIATLEDRGEAGMEKTIDTEDDKISLVLELSANGYPPDVPNVKAVITDRRYLLCPSAVSVGHLKKFIRVKFNVPSKYQIQFYHTRFELSDNLSLYDISTLYTWRWTKPLRLFYMIYNPPPKNHSQILTPETKRRRLSGFNARQEKKLAGMLELKSTETAITINVVKSTKHLEGSDDNDTDMCTVTRDVNENCVIRKSEFSIDDVKEFIRPKTPINGKHKLSRTSECFVKTKMPKLDIFCKSATKKSKHSESSKLLNDNKIVDGMKLLKINKNGDVFNNFKSETKPVFKIDFDNEEINKTTTIDDVNMPKVNRSINVLIRPGKNIKTNDVKPPLCTNSGDVKVEFNWRLPNNKISDVIMQSMLPKDPAKSSIVKPGKIVKKSRAKTSESVMKTNRSKNPTDVTKPKTASPRSRNVKTKPKNDTSSDATIKSSFPATTNKTHVKLKPEKVEKMAAVKVADDLNIVDKEVKDKITTNNPSKLQEIAINQSDLKLEAPNVQTANSTYSRDSETQIGWLNSRNTPKKRYLSQSDDLKTNEKQNDLKNWEYLKAKYSKKRSKCVSRDKEDNHKPKEPKSDTLPKKPIPNCSDVLSRVSKHKANVKNEHVDNRIHEATDKKNNKVIDLDVKQTAKSSDVGKSKKANVIGVQQKTNDASVKQTDNVCHNVKQADKKTCQINNVIVKTNNVILSDNTNEKITQNSKKNNDIEKQNDKIDEIIVKQNDKSNDHVNTSDEKNNSDVNNFNVRTKKQRAIDVIVKQINQRNDIIAKQNTQKNDPVTASKEANLIRPVIVQVDKQDVIGKSSNTETLNLNHDVTINPDKIKDVSTINCKKDKKVSEVGEYCSKKLKKQYISATNTHNQNNNNKNSKSEHSKTNKNSKSESSNHSNRETSNHDNSENNAMEESALCHHNSLIFKAGFATDPYSFEMDGQPLDVSDISRQTTMLYNK